MGPTNAYGCLGLVPLDIDHDLALLDLIRPAIEWQSSVSFLKDPPKEYLSEAVDLFAGLDTIRKNLHEGRYVNQFEFTKDLYQLLNIRPRDSLLEFVPRLLDLFYFMRGVQFVSVSKDGLSEPDVYVFRKYTPNLPTLLLPSLVSNIRFLRMTITLT